MKIDSLIFWLISFFLLRSFFQKSNITETNEKEMDLSSNVDPKLDLSQIDSDSPVGVIEAKPIILQTNGVKPMPHHKVKKDEKFKEYDERSNEYNDNSKEIQISKIKNKKLLDGKLFFNHNNKHQKSTL